MICPNCEKETLRLFYEKKEEEGTIKTFVFCPLCPKVKSNRSNFPAIITGKRKRGRPKKIKELQSNRQEGLVDNWEKRRRDDISDFENRHTVICFGDLAKDKISSHITKKFDSKFGPGNWRLRKSDGVSHEAERIKSA